MALEPKVNSEVAAVIEAQRAALARLGLMASLLATSEWVTVSALRPAENAAAWAAHVIRAVYALRIRARRVAIAGYQLGRALDTGYTLGAPLEGSPALKQATLGSLRHTFETELLAVGTIDTEPGGIDDPDIRWLEEQLRELTTSPRVPERVRRGAEQVFQDTSLDPYIQNLLDKQGSDDEERITIEPFDWGDDLTLKQVEDVYEKAILNEAVKSQEDFIAKARAQDKSPDQVLSEIDEHHDKAGGIGAGNADAAVMDAPRDAASRAIRKDRRVKLVARGTGPNPCAFCAMLASRGFVYASKKTAGFGGTSEIDKFHIHCHCYPIVRWVDAAELPPLSQFFKDNWADVTKGYTTTEGHPDALNAWRRWLYAKRKQGFQFPSNINA